MSPDISYIARFDKVQKQRAIDLLGDFCVNTDDFGFNSKLISNDCFVSFVIKDEVETQWFKEHYAFAGALSGRTVMGSIQLWIKEIGDCCEFEFCAVNGSVGKVCLDSKELRDRLIDFAMKVNGQSLELDWSDGRIEVIIQNH